MRILTVENTDGFAHPVAKPEGYRLSVLDILPPVPTPIGGPKLIATPAVAGTMLVASSVSTWRNTIFL